MSTDISTLGLEVKSDGVATASDRLKQLSRDGAQTDAAASKLSSTFDKLGYSTQSLVKYIEAAAGALALMKLVEMAQGAALLAARYDTLGVVVQTVGKNAVYTGSQMAGFQTELQKAGIAAIESRQALARMGEAQIDFANSAKLARIAQDAAVIANTNSSDAFERMIMGLSTGQSIILHHLGLMTNFEVAYKRAADAMGKTTNDLSETEKAQIRVNEVMRAGVGIQGAYEAAMGTVGKQITSLPRYIKDLEVQIGELGQGALFTSVKTLTDSLKFVSKNFEDIANAAGMLAGAGVAVAFARITSAVEPAIAAQLRYTIALAQGNAVTLGSATAAAQKAAAQVAETEAAAAATAAQVAYWQSELASAEATKAATVAQGQAVEVGKSRAFSVQRIAVANMEVNATEIMLAEALAADTAATAADTAAKEALAAAMTAASVQGRVMTGVMSGLNTVLALVGGPIGAIAIAIGGVTYSIIKFLEQADVAQSKLAQLQNQGDFAQTLQKLKEIEDLNRRTADANKSAGQLAKEGDAAMQEKINKAQKENLELLKKRDDMVRSGDNTSARDKIFGTAPTEWDKLNAKIKDNNNLIQYGTRVQQEMNAALAEQERLRKSKHTEPKTTTPVEYQDKESYGKSLREAHEGYLRYLDEWDKRVEAQARNAQDLELNALKNQKDQLLITEREYGQQVIAAKVAELERVKNVEDAQYQAAVNRANAIDAVLKKQKDGTYADGYLADGSRVGVEEYNEANKAAEAARIQKEAADTRLKAAQQDQAAYGKTNSVLDERAAKELEVQRLSVMGNALESQRIANELKYADLLQKTGNTDLVRRTKEIDDLKSLCDLQARRVAAEKELYDLRNSNAATAASLVGVNSSTGTISTIDDQTANQLAVQQQAHEARIQAIEREKQDALAAMMAQQMAYEDYTNKIVELDKKAALERKANSLAVTKITIEGEKSKLYATSEYTGMAGQFFNVLASTQDESSRKGFETAKNYNLAAAIMNTASGIMAQLSGPDGWSPMAWARAALVGVTGAIQVAKIASTSFGGGGSVASISAGSFGGASGGSGVGASIGPQIRSAQDTQTEDSLRRLADASDNASMAIGKVADGLTKIGDLFQSDYSKNVTKGLTTSAPESGKGVLSQVWGDMGGLKGALLNPLVGITAAISGMFHAFGFGNSWYTTGSGIALGLNGGGLSGLNYVDRKKDGGWFSSDKTRTEYSAMNSQLQGVLQDNITQIMSAISRSAVALGTTTNFGAASVPMTRISTAGRSAEDIQKDVESFFTTAANALAKTTAGLEKFAFYGEDAFAAIIRLSTSLQGVNEQLSLIGHTLISSSLEGADAAYRLSDAFGGLDKMKDATDKYFSAMFTESEQAARKAVEAQRQVNTAFSEMGIKAPATRDGFRDLVNSLDLTNASQAATYVSLMKIAEAFGTVQDAADKAAQANQDLQSRLLHANGDPDADLYDLRMKQAAEMQEYIQKGYDTAKLATVQQKEYANAVKEVGKAYKSALVDTAMTAANNIKSIAGGNLSILSPQQQYEQQKAAMNAAIASGNAAQINALAQQFLTASKAYNASGIGYTGDYNMVMKALAKVAGISDPSLVAAQRQIDLLQKISDNSKLFVTATTTLAQLIAQQLGVPVGLPKFASGGITNGMAIAGEAGREAVIPLPDGRTVPVTMQGNSELLEELRELRAEVRELRQQAIGKLTDIESPLRRVAARA